MSWFGRQCKKHASNGWVAFLFIGLAATALLLLVVFQKTSPDRVSILELPQDAPHFALLLPSGSVYDDDSIVRMFDPGSGTVSFAVAYMRGMIAELALIQWDNKLGKYGVTSTMSLNMPELKFSGLPDVKAEPMGDGLSHAVTISGPSGVSDELTFLAVLRLGELKQVYVNDSGSTSVGIFHSGPTLSESERAKFIDLDADGMLELMVTKLLRTRDGDESQDIRVHAWNMGRFELNEKLTWAMDVRERVFPEPPGDDQ